MTDITATLREHLTAAETEGRSISDGEASLIERIASMPATVDTVDVEARNAIERLRDEMQDASSSTVAPRVTASLLPDTEGMTGLLQAIQTRQPFSVQAATYDVQRPIDTVTRTPMRLTQRLQALGATVAPVARKLEVPRIASGDAAVWTTGEKAEIVTELGLVEADIVAAWTEVTAMNFIDLQALELQLGNLLGRRVIVQENVAVGESLLAQGTAGTGGSTATEAVVDALVTAAACGQAANVLILSDDIASAVMADAQSGYAGLDDYWRGTLFGVQFYVVPGLTASTVIAADATALVIGQTPVMQLVDPYSSSKTNGVILRTETSVAIAALDPYAVGTSTVLVGP